MSESSIDDANGLDVPMTGEQPADAYGEGADGRTDVEGTPFGDPAPAADLTPDDPAVRGT